MNKVSQFSFLLLAIASTGMAKAGDTLSVKDFRFVGPLALQVPVQIDSTDTQGQKQDVMKSLLGAYSNIQSVHDGIIWRGEELPASGDELRAGC